jgi:hypothetical protein
MPRSLEEQLNGADPEPWIADDAGDSIFGEIEAVGTREGDYGEYTVVTVVTENEDVLTIAGFGTVLAGKLSGLSEDDIGRKIGVKFLGEKKGKNGKEYKDWKVVLGARPTVAVAAADEFADEDI